MKEETLKKLQSSQLEMLSVFDAFCRKYKLRYFLVGGTLLGAVRHKGFIPWDDDSDVGMPRKDYNFMIKHFQKFAGDKFFLQTAKTDKYYGRNFAKLRLNNTIFLEQVDCLIDKRHHGIFLDIFPFDNTKEKLGLFGRMKKRAMLVLDCYITVVRTKMPLLSRKQKLLKILPIRFCIFLREIFMRGHGPILHFNYKVPANKDDVFPLKVLEFEGETFCVPKDYDKILRKQYGEYMQLPPVSKRETHNPVRISFNVIGGEDEDLN